MTDKRRCSVKSRLLHIYVRMYVYMPYDSLHTCTYMQLSFHVYMYMYVYLSVPYTHSVRHTSLRTHVPLHAAHVRSPMEAE